MFRVEALIFGLSWITFGFARSLKRARELEQQVAIADPRRWPGRTPRQTRLMLRVSGPEGWEWHRYPREVEPMDFLLPMSGEPDDRDSLAD